jgi:periplasmic mercuric ion binding protein
MTLDRNHCYLRRFFMRANTMCTALLVTTLVTLLVLLAFRVRIGGTADSIAVLQATGINCDRCSSTITLVLERERGVAVTAVDVAKGWVIVGYDPKTIKPDTLASKVTAAGFSSKVYAVLTPEQFKQVTGKEIGKMVATAKGCGSCGSKREYVTQQ